MEATAWRLARFWTIRESGEHARSGLDPTWVSAESSALSRSRAPSRCAGGIASAAILATNSSALDRFGSIAPTHVAGTVYDYRKSTLSLVASYVVDHPLGAGLGSVGPAAEVAGGP